MLLTQEKLRATVGKMFLLLSHEIPIPLGKTGSSRKPGHYTIRYPINDMSTC